MPRRGDRLLGFTATTLLALGGVALGARQAELSEREVDAVLSRHAHEIRRCYLEHAQPNGATGQVTLELEARRGRVSRGSVKAVAEGVRGEAFQRCMERTVYRWRFPYRASPTLIRTPYLFQSTSAPGAGPSKR